MPSAKKSGQPTPSRPTKKASACRRGDQAGFLTVGQTARVLGVSTSTLRVWENVGLVTPTRSEGRFRLYTLEMLDLLKRIKYLRDVKQIGVPGIKRMLAERDPEISLNPSGKRSLKVPAHDGAPAKSIAKPRAAAPRQSLGERLRVMRKRCGIGVVEAANRAGISAGFLSAIELSRANASIATLQRLAAIYGTSVLELFDLPRKPNRLVHPQDRRNLKTDSNVTMEVLAFGTRMLQCMMFDVQPGAGSDGAYSHYGEEFIYMLEGTVEFWLDEMECHILNAGDSFWFDSTMGHRWFNSSDKRALLLWINTPITF